VADIVNDLGRQVVGSAADGFPLLPWVLDPSSQAKITDLDLHIFIKHDVAELKAG